MSKRKKRQSIEEVQAFQDGLHIFNPKIKQKVRIEFKDLTDEETICFIMCEFCGWSYNRLEKIIKISNPTIKERVLSAIGKRKMRKKK